MALNIKNLEVENAIRRLAKERGLDLTEAIGLAVMHELERGTSALQTRLRRMRSVADRIAGMPIRDHRSDEEILGYDEAGLPS